MDVGVWLRSLGLGQYEATFRDNEIDGAVLPKLTVDDLKDLGVAVVGHRRKIMSAIQELNAAPVARADAIKPLQTQAPPSVGAHSDGAERRPITVMFCDLVGSTGLASRLDAEDWRDLVSAYLDAASGAVTQMGGRIATKLGDGLMALFGHPIAQENDSERAVRVALRIQGALAELNRHNAGLGRPELVARIGISRAGRWWWMRPEKSSAMRPTSRRACRPGPSQARSWSLLACSVRCPAYSSRRIVARIS